MTELKLCPFCGGKANLTTEYLVIGLAVSKVECMSCGASTAENSAKNAIRLWNRRADDDSN